MSTSVVAKLELIETDTLLTVMVIIPVSLENGKYRQTFQNLMLIEISTGY
jgi:hypothetical protein